MLNLKINFITMFRKLIGFFILFFCLIFGLSILMSIANSFIEENQFANRSDGYNSGVIVGKIIANVFFIFLLYRFTKFGIKLISNKKVIISEIDEIGETE